ncbi:hypothetical protein H6P81_010154 [Aristolochia fimbriata]|uniref:Uncharacterized protein n=1 Tax=Aristolochia fimbriata TaxID=158543 RepID=A0AAV7EP69_ARIFI|nr:hypothetical protein H6P81_010154 [Aristolochia fimbriata]
MAAASKEGELRKGPWTLEEDSLLIHYISSHGEGRWNLLARCSGLKRTGKSCRLRWLNYLKPDVKRGNLTPEEQLLILELHSKWGNRWSRIAQHLPGRTDNEIKNYWRTRVQKQARQLKIDANSTKFRDAIRFFWMPRLLQQMQSTHDQKRSNSTIQAPESSQVVPVSPQTSDECYHCSTPSCISSDSKNMTQYEIGPDEFPTSPHINNLYNPFQRGTTSNHYVAETWSYDLESLNLGENWSWDVLHETTEMNLWVDMDELRPIIRTTSS